VSDRTRERINAAFDDELSSAPVPPSLRALSVRAAVAAPRRRSAVPQVLALVAAVLVIALVATVFVDTHLHRATPAPAGSTLPPAPKANAASTFDQAHGVMLVFGGGSGPNPPTNETWTWDGKYWVHLRPAVSPAGRDGAVMAYDAAHRNVVLFGGSVFQKLSPAGGCCQLTPVDDTWTWDGTTWHQMHPRNQPRFGGFDQSSSMQFDPVSRMVVLFGFSQSAAGVAPTPEVWSWNGSDWKKLPPTTLPTSPSAIVNDGHQLLLLTGAMVGGRYITQTLAWTGTDWSLLHPTVSLPLIGTASGAYDPGRKELVLLTGDTWVWDGSRWARQHPTLQPQGIGYMAYMPSLGKVVSWGDRTASVDNEIFGWDGAEWKVIEPGSVVPPATNGKGGFNYNMSPEQAAAIVRETVKNTRPVLLPTVLPAGGPFDVRVNTDPDGFNLDYMSDLRDKTIDFGIGVANPPPGGPSSGGKPVKFRNSLPQKYGAPGYAYYFVYDSADPYSQRWLMWSEPGSMVNPMLKDGGVPYFLGTTGLTDQEFWQVANSLG
jgi:hypothetical protein